ncbi:MAG: hypothetical protein ACK4YM_05850, partial [Novosphingobium sp.]
MSDLALLALADNAGFRRDPRFAPVRVETADAADPLSRAWAEGHAAGLAEARAEAQAQAAAEAEAR